MRLPLFLLIVLNLQDFGLLLGSALENMKITFFFGETILLISMLSGGYLGVI